MKTELRLAAHTQIPGATVVEIWHGGVFLGIIVGADGPGVRIISKYITNSADAIVIDALEPPAVRVKLEP